MKKAAWALSYCLLLIRQSLLLWILFVVQAMASVGSSQGREILKTLLMEKGNFSSLFFYEVFHICTGIFYFSTCYWFLFFASVKGSRYDDPVFYASSGQKIEAWNYQEFLIQYRGYLIRMMSGILLFLPGILQCTLLFFPGFPAGPVWAISLTTLFFNFSIVYFRSNRNSVAVKAFRLVSEGFARSFENAATRLLKTLRRWFLPPILIDSIHPPKQELSITTELRVNSLFQAHPKYRGQFYMISLAGFLLWIFLLNTSNDVLEVMGPIALLEAGICVLIFAILIVNFLNSVYIFPFYLFLGVMLILSSYVNEDHPIQQTLDDRIPEQTKKLPLSAHFENWVQHRDWYNHSVWEKEDIDTVRMPVFIVCAEGGANRSGYWTSQMLQYLREKTGTGFDENLFAMSSVSGGSFGTHLYSLCRTNHLDPALSRSAMRGFFESDYLSPLTNRLMCGESIQLFLPWYSVGLDRAAAFESGISDALKKQFPNQKDHNFFSRFRIPDTASFNPILLTHCTEAETGRRSILSNANLEDADFNEAVLLNSFFEKDLSISTAMHLSARFPVFSPSAAIKGPDGETRHYVDGGYYDRGGYETAMELIRAIESSRYSDKVQPILIVLSNSLESGTSVLGGGSQEDKKERKMVRRSPSTISFLNEPLSILNTLVSSGQNNTDVHKKLLLAHLKRNYPNQLYHLEFDLKASGSEIPMNWYLSPNGFKRIEKKAKQLSSTIPRFVFPQQRAIPDTVQENTELEPLKKTVFDNKSNPVPGIESRTSNPNLYYYSKKLKKWRKKSDADFNLVKIKPLGKTFGKRKKRKEKN